MKTVTPEFIADLLINEYHRVKDGAWRQAQIALWGELARYHSSPMHKAYVAALRHVECHELAVENRKRWSKPTGIGYKVIDGVVYNTFDGFMEHPNGPKRMTTYDCVDLMP